MSDLSAVTPLRVAVVHAIEILEAPAVEVLAAGVYARLATGTGKLELGNDTDAAEGRKGGIVIESAIVGQTASILRRGTIDVGDVLGGLDYDADVYLSDTDGLLGTASGSTGRIVGTVVPGWAQNTPDKLLRVNL